jgi:hypothetical protein
MAMGLRVALGVLAVQVAVRKHLELRGLLLPSGVVLAARSVVALMAARGVLADSEVVAVRPVALLRGWVPMGQTAVREARLLEPPRERTSQ